METEANRERLRALLDEQAESPTLDYKEACDLNEKRDLVKIAKHVGAMQPLGGHIVIGADGAGRASRKFSEAQAKLFDEATLRPKLLRYLPPSIQVRSAVHDLDGDTFGVVYIAPHPDGLVPFIEDGSYEDNGRLLYAFRKGQIYTRHGTSSVPCEQEDVQRVLRKQLEGAMEGLRAERAEELAELARTLQNQSDLARAPATALTWQLDEESFVTTIIEQLRLQDEIPLRLLLRRADRDAAVAIQAGTPADLELILDRLACLATAFVTLDQEKLFHQVVAALVRIYNLGFDSRGMTRHDLPVGPAMIWLQVIKRVLVVGAALVREQKWDLARALVLQRGSGYEFTEKKHPYVTWIRHATTEAARAGHFDQVVDGQRTDVSLLWMAKQVVDGSPTLAEATGPDDEGRIGAICQFDMVAMIVSLGAAGNADSRHYYPHFARFYEHRSLPALERVITDPDIRQTLFPSRSDKELANVIRWIDHSATQEGFRYAGWDGFLNDTVREFLDKNPSPG